MKIEVKDISRTYKSKSGEVQALSPTSFTIEEGEFVCLLGPSGCGKSTLLFILAGLQDASGGEILLDDAPVVGPGRERGLVFQRYTLYPWLTVRENAAFSNHLQANTKGKSVGELFDRISRADYLLNLTGLEQFASSYPAELSGGMQQRVAIVRALVNKPRVLLMDEPFGALDSQTREEMQQMLLLLAKHEKITVVFVTHDVEEAIFLGSRVLVFSRRPGRIIRDEKIPFQNSADLQSKLTPEFYKLKRELLDTLHQASGQEDGESNRIAMLQNLVASSENQGIQDKQ